MNLNDSTNEKFPFWSYRYEDTSGNKLKKIEFKNGKELISRYEYDYDEEGNKTQTRIICNFKRSRTRAIISVLYDTTIIKEDEIIEYDSSGLKVKLTKRGFSNIVETKEIFDSTGKLIQVDEFDQYLTKKTKKYNYVNDELIMVSEYDSVGGLLRIYHFDRENNKISEIFPYSEGSVVSPRTNKYNYDNKGYLIHYKEERDLMDGRYSSCGSEDYYEYYQNGLLKLEVEIDSIQQKVHAIGLDSTFFQFLKDYPIELPTTLKIGIGKFSPESNSYTYSIPVGQKDTAKTYYYYKYFDEE